MQNDSGIINLLESKVIQEKQKLALQGEIRWDEVSPVDDPSVSPPHVDKWDSNLLVEIYEWWEDNYSKEIEKYNRSLYPIDIEEFKGLIEDSDRSAWLMLFFIGATYTMGRTQNEQHRDFLRFCINNGWWDIFSKPEPEALSQEWMNIIDEYLDSLSNNTTWYYWIEKYPNIYQISKYLEEYRESFLRAERIRSNFDLDSLTNPRLAQDLSGGGVDAPPLRLGIGANFVIRELVRLDIIDSTELIREHCFVPRANIRKIMMKCGCQELQTPDYRYSKIIYNFLTDQPEKLDVTFKNCFDIAFEMYSQSFHLDLSDFRVRDDVGLYEIINEGKYTQYERSSGVNGECITLSDGRVIPNPY